MLRINGDVGDEPLGQALRRNLVPAVGGPRVRRLRAPDVSREPREELRTVTDRITATAVTRIDVRAVHRDRGDLVVDTPSMVALALPKIEHRLPVGVGRLGGVRPGGRLDDLAAAGQQMFWVLRVHHERRVERGVVDERADVAPRLAAVGADVDDRSRVFLVDDAAAVGIGLREDAVTSVDLYLAAVRGDADLAVVLEPGIDHAVLRGGDAVGEERVEPDLGALSEPVLAEIGGRAAGHVLGVVPAVVAGHQRYSAVPVRDEHAGMLVGVRRGVVRVRALALGASVRREHEEAGTAVRVVRADRLEVRPAVLRRRGSVLEDLLQAEHESRRHAVDLLRRIGLDPLVVPRLDARTDAERGELCEH